MHYPVLIANDLEVVLNDSWMICLTLGMLLRKNLKSTSYGESSSSCKTMLVTDVGGRLC